MRVLHAFLTLLNTGEHPMTARHFGLGSRQTIEPLAHTHGRELRWHYDDQVFRLSTGGARADERLIPVIEDRLFLLSTKSTPVAKPSEYYISLNKRLQYIPFCADFGPFNLGTTYHVVSILKSLFRHPDHSKTKVIYFTSQEPTDVTNAIYLLGAFLCLYLDATPDEAFSPFAEFEHQKCIPYRDATWTKSTFDLHVKDCWSALLKASEANLFDVHKFDKNHYFYYDDPQNGEFHEVVPGKFIAFRGPSEYGFEHMDGSYTLPAEDYVEVFQSKRVTDIVRLNSIEYNADVFRQNGFKHHDLFFEDCSTPNDSIVDKFLRICEGAEGMVAVHCLAGLGRTGTLIALYLMKHQLFTACQAIAWLRICRPGSVIGPQQQFLEAMQDLMHQCGREGHTGFPQPSCAEHSMMTFCRTKSAENREAKRSGLLADMVTVGLRNRAILRARRSSDPSKTASGSSSASSASDPFSRTQSADGGGNWLKPKAAVTAGKTDLGGSFTDHSPTASFDTVESSAKEQEPCATGGETKSARPRMQKHPSRGIRRTQSAGDGLGAMSGAAHNAIKSNRNGLGGLGSQRRSPHIEMEAGQGPRPGSKKPTSLVAEVNSRSNRDTSSSTCSALPVSPVPPTWLRAKVIDVKSQPHGPAPVSGGRRILSPQSAPPSSSPRYFNGSSSASQAGEKFEEEGKKEDRKGEGARELLWQRTIDGCLPEHSAQGGMGTVTDSPTALTEQEQKMTQLLETKRRMIAASKLRKQAVAR